MSNTFAQPESFIHNTFVYHMINVSYIHTKNSNDITCLNIAVEGIIPNEDKKKEHPFCKSCKLQTYLSFQFD